MELPQAFLHHMRQTFEEYGRIGEFAAFVASFDDPPAPALRINRSKWALEEGLEALRQRYTLPEWKRVPWSEDGVYLPEGWTPGLTAEYLQGLFYLQEASAMLPAQVAGTQPGWRVLDLCSAPGGKAMRLSDDLQGRGLLLCNEPSLERARILLRNLEQGGSAASVLHAKAQDLPEVFRGSFDLVVVDAPCSGEGMFGRDPRAISSWETYHTEAIRPLQAEILDVAASLLRPGGRLIYSTCTFNLDENERQIAHFLQTHTEFILEDARARLPERARSVVSSGFPGIAGHPTELCLRIWPHQVRGEGHFCASLHKAEAPEWSVEQVQDRVVIRDRYKGVRTEPSRSIFSDHAGEQEVLWNSWAAQHLSLEGQKRLAMESTLFSERQYLHCMTEMAIEPEGLHWLKRGILLGSVRSSTQARVERSPNARHVSDSFSKSRGTSRLDKARFEGGRGGKTFTQKDPGQGKWIPAHALALYLRWEDLVPQARLEIGDQPKRLRAYLGGQTWIPTQEESNLCGKSQQVLLFSQGQPVGWVAVSGLVWKNLYPASWQRVQVQVGKALADWEESEEESVAGRKAEQL